MRCAEGTGAALSGLIVHLATQHIAGAGCSRTEEQKGRRARLSFKGHCLVRHG